MIPKVGLPGPDEGCDRHRAVFAIGHWLIMEPHGSAEPQIDRRTAELAEIDTAATELPEVQVAKFSRGSTFEFEPRSSLPLTVI